MSKPKPEPNVAATVVAGLGLAVVGVILGIVYFVSFPLQAHTNQRALNAALDQKENPHFGPGDSYYFKGPVLRGKSWAPKREQLFAGEVQKLEFKAGELNGWLDTYFKPAAPVSGEESSGITIRPDMPNLAVVEPGRLDVSLPATLEAFGWKGKFVLSATGYFESGAPADFVVRKMNLNGARLPGFIGQLLVGRLAKAYRQTEEYGRIIESWQRVESVDLAEGALRLSLR